MTQTIYISALRSRGPLVLISLAALIWIGSAHADDLKTLSGRIYRDATISRVDADGLVIQHKFGIVKVPFQNIAPESREKFNPQKAADLAKNSRRENQDRVGDHEREIGQRTEAETAERRRFVTASEENAEAEAETFATRIHQNVKPRVVVSNTAMTFHIRGQIVAAGPTGYLVRCAEGPQRSSSDFLSDGLTFVTSDINEFVPGDYIDVRASADGKETTFHTYLGQVYPGRFQIYRMIRDRRPEVCVGFLWYGSSIPGIVR